MDEGEADYGLEFLLAFDGRVHHLEDGCWLKFEIERVEASKERPQGLSYSFTLHAPDGIRLVGFDNAHGVPALGSRFRKAVAGERSLASHGGRSRTAIQVQRRRYAAARLLSRGSTGAKRTRSF